MLALKDCDPSFGRVEAKKIFDEAGSAAILTYPYPSMAAESGRSSGNYPLDGDHLMVSAVQTTGGRFDGCSGSTPNSGESSMKNLR